MNGMLHGFGFEEEGVATWLRERGFDLATYDADAHELTFGGAPWHGRANALAVCRARRDEVQKRLSPRSADPR